MAVSKRRLSACIARVLHHGKAGLMSGIALGLPFAVQAECNLTAPASGQTVTCTSAAPNPSTSGILAVAGSSGVTVNVAAGAALDVATGPGVQLYDQSRVNNDGSIVARSGAGVLFSGTVGSTLVNRGNITGAGTGVGFGTGNDRLEMLAGRIVGAITQGAGDDVLLLESGQLDAVDQGAGADRMTVNGGSVAGTVQQGAGVDDFAMTGGEIGALLQGDNLDTFRMSGGRIVGAFEDGDYAEMTGGRIGRVNMKLDDNTFDMSGGTIDGNLVTGFGNDTIHLRDGYIGGNISVSGGNDNVSVSGGIVRGEVRISAGDDVFAWNGGGVIYGAIDLGEGTDSAALTSLNRSHLGATPGVLGGLGNDTLAFDNVSTDGIARFQQWETVNARDDTELTFDGDLVLGDAGSGTGSLAIDAASTLFAGNGANASILAFGAGQLATVSNSGRIDLTNGTSGATDRFIIAGNYIGNNAAVYLQTVLGDDSSASDRLVISAGTASGNTGLGVVNLGGAGGSTVLDGIMVVEAINGATSTGNAFALTAPVAAGAFEYFLFKGGISAGTGENWYLRSALVTTPEPPTPAPAPDPLESESTAPPPTPPEPLAPPPPDLPPPPTLETPDDPNPEVPPAPPPAPPPEPPAAEPPSPPPPEPLVPTDPAPVPDPLAVPSPPTPDAIAATPNDQGVIPLYRVEAPTYAVMPPVVHQLSLASLGTFHERQGEQALLQGDGVVRAAWGRVVGQRTEQHWRGTVAPVFEGSITGLQAGVDIYARENDDNRRDHFGLFLGRTRADGDVRGFALGWNNLAVGKAELDDDHLGLYWSRIGGHGGYLDAVLLGSRYDGKSTSSRGLGIDMKGDGLTASLEIGRPVRWRDGGRWSLEPQAQVVWQRVSLDRQRDAFADVDFDSDNAITGRVGLRLSADFATARGLWQPYLKLNYWHGFGGQDVVRFDADRVVTQQKYNAIEFGGGLVAKFNAHASLYLSVDYTSDTGDEGLDRETVEGNLGLRMAW